MPPLSGNQEQEEAQLGRADQAPSWLAKPLAQMSCPIHPTGVTWERSPSVSLASLGTLLSAHKGKAPLDRKPTIVQPCPLAPLGQPCPLAPLGLRRAPPVSGSSWRGTHPLAALLCSVCTEQEPAVGSSPAATPDANRPSWLLVEHRLVTATSVRGTHLRGRPRAQREVMPRSPHCLLPNGTCFCCVPYRWHCCPKN